MITQNMRFFEFKKISGVFLFALFVLSLAPISFSYGAPAGNICFQDMDLLRAAAVEQKSAALAQAIRIFDAGEYRGSVLGDEADARFSDPRGTILLTLAWLDGTDPQLLTLKVCDNRGKLTATDNNGRTFQLKESGNNLVIKFGFFSSTFKRLSR